MFKTLGYSEVNSIKSRLQQIYNLIYLKENYSKIRSYLKILEYCKKGDFRFISLVNCEGLAILIKRMDSLLTYYKNNKILANTDIGTFFNIEDSVNETLTMSVTAELILLFNCRYIYDNVDSINFHALALSDIQTDILATKSFKPEEDEDIGRFITHFLELLGYGDKVHFGDIFNIDFELEDFELDIGHLIEYEYKILCLVIKLPIGDINNLHEEFKKNLKIKCSEVLEYEDRSNELKYSGLSLDGELVVMFECLDVMDVYLIDEIVKILRFCEGNNLNMAMS